jgi:N-acetylmuramoyl-L-alanine amidase
MIGPIGARRVAVAIVSSCLLLSGCATSETGAATPAASSSSPARQISAAPTAAASPTADATTGTATARITARKPAPKTRSTRDASTEQTQARPMIVIDPGHSGRSIRSRDNRAGLIDFDYPNYPEMYEVFQVSTCVARNLRAIGYRVILTKKRATSSVSLADRARIADHAHAVLAISVHNDHSQGPSFQAVYSQRGVRHHGRYHQMWRGRGSHRTVFRHPTIARKSARDTRLIARERSKAQGRPVEITEENFTGRAGLEPGNLALVQLLSHVPWVYSEAGARTGGSTTRRMTLRAQAAYAKGILDGIVAAVPVTGAHPESKAAIRQCIRQQRNG